MELVIAAANLFPFSRALRTRPGYLVMAAEPSPRTVDILSRTLASDRHSSDLASAYVRHRLAVEGPFK